jgi:hypothetical protein
MLKDWDWVWERSLGIDRKGLLRANAIDLDSHGLILFDCNLHPSTKKKKKKEKKKKKKKKNFTGKVFEVGL